MANTAKLARFSIVPEGDDFQLHIEDSTGETLELTATEDQLEVLVEALDEALSSDSTSEEVEGELDTDDED